MKEINGQNLDGQIHILVNEIEAYREKMIHLRMTTLKS